MTELQAQVIIEMQVQRFTQIEHLKIRDELTNIREFIAAGGV
jgi:DNA gyrase/topoisomerase IV subunit A